MKNNVVYLDGVSWFEDPYNAIDRLMDEYDEEKEEKRKTKFDIKHKDETIEVVDFENDPDNQRTKNRNLKKNNINAR